MNKFELWIFLSYKDALSQKASVQRTTALNLLSFVQNQIFTVRTINNIIYGGSHYYSSMHIYK